LSHVRASNRAFPADVHDLLLFDLDGVLYRGDEPVPGAAEAIARARRAGTKVLFLTNNSARTPSEVAERLERMGFDAAEDEVLTSAMATAALLQRQSTTGTAFVIGERGIREALTGAGIEVVDGTPTRTDLVVVGWDRGLDYDKLRTAALLIQRGARLIATNADASYPATDGLWPGAGSILAAVTTATGATPLVVGKPGRPRFEAAAEMTGATRPLMVGDRLDTDIAGAANIGWESFLVLTGASRPPDLLVSDALPSYVASDLSGLWTERPPAEIRPAVAEDAGAVAELLRASDVPADGVEERIGDGWTTVIGGREALATAAVVQLGSDGLLRSVAVRPDARGSGLGMLAVAGAARRSRAAGIGSLALFTDAAAAFFERLGFTAVTAADLPPAVQGTKQARECRESATAMIRDLRTNA
jgi:glycerol 3-phosphatase-2